MRSTLTGIFLLIPMLTSAANAQVPDGETLAERFRPYYKFSVDRGREPCRPCSWQWFAAHGELYHGAQRLATASQLASDPSNLLSFADADIRTTRQPVGLLKLRAKTPESHAGEPWSAVINDGAGLYAQCEDAGGGLIVLTYWTLFGFNKTTVTGDHEGDIIAVTVIYSRFSNRLVRVSYGMHGAVIESFDLPPTSEELVELKGRDPENKPVSILARRVRTPRNYQDGPWWHSPSRAEVYFAQDPDSRRFEHLAIYCEWGSHEPWPNPTGSVMTAPKHTGDDVSFLPRKVRYLGSFADPTPTEAPFVYFNGVWGDDPKGIIFHRACFYPEGRAKNRFKIPLNKFVDRDFFDGARLGWPPAK
jgi:hypothetical protein